MVVGTFNVLILNTKSELQDEISSISGRSCHQINIIAPQIVPLAKMQFYTTIDVKDTFELLDMSIFAFLCVQTSIHMYMRVLLDGKQWSWIAHGQAYINMRNVM